MLAPLMLTQTILYIRGLCPDPNFGFKAEMYRFFSTVFTGYAAPLMACHRGMTLGDLGFNRHLVLCATSFAGVVAFVSGSLFLGLFALGAIRLAALGVFFIPVVFIPIVFMLGGGMVIVDGNHLPRAALPLIPPALATTPRRIAQRLRVRSVPPQRHHTHSADTDRNRVCLGLRPNRLPG